MTATLKQLREHLDVLIKQSGEDTVCRSWIYTDNNVFTLNKYGEWIEDRRDIRYRNKVLLNR